MGLSTLSGWMSHATQATESAALGKDMVWFRLKFGYEQLYTPTSAVRVRSEDILLAGQETLAESLLPKRESRRSK